MPNRTQHLRISKNLLGEGNPLIHQILDSSSLLVGSKHREHSHTLSTVQWIEQGFGEKGRREAILHILYDANIVTDKDIIKWSEKNMKCPKCNYEWNERKEKPKSCPRCKIRFDYKKR